MPHSLDPGRQLPFLISASDLQALDGEGLVRGDGPAVHELEVGIGREGDQAQVPAGERPGGESVVVAELSAPARGEAERAAVDAGGGGPAGRRAGDGVGAARLGLSDVGVDGEAHEARSVVCVAGAGETLHSPARDGGSGNTAGLDGRGGSSGSGEAEEDGEVLHFDDVWWLSEEVGGELAVED